MGAPGARDDQGYVVVLFGLVAGVFAYTTVVNVLERPDGLRIGAIFIVGIVVASFLSRMRRALELRGVETTFDVPAQAFLAGAARSGNLRLVAHHPVQQGAEAYRDKIREVHRDHDVPRYVLLVLLEVAVVDASDFETTLHVHEVERFGFRVLTVRSSVVPNAIAEILLAIRDRTGMLPHVYFTWTEGNPLLNLARFLFAGAGEVAPLTREVLREAEPDPDRRPHVHVA